MHAAAVRAAKKLERGAGRFYLIVFKRGMVQNLAPGTARVLMGDVFRRCTGKLRGNGGLLRNQYVAPSASMKLVMHAKQQAHALGLAWSLPTFPL